VRLQGIAKASDVVQRGATAAVAVMQCTHNNRIKICKRSRRARLAAVVRHRDLATRGLVRLEARRVLQAAAVGARAQEAAALRLGQRILVCSARAVDGKLKQQQRVTGGMLISSTRAARCRRTRAARRFAPRMLSQPRHSTARAGITCECTAMHRATPPQGAPRNEATSNHDQTHVHS
jgi:hypothetical protein